MIFRKLYASEVASWSFLTNHARVLLCVAHDPGVRLRDIAASLDITQRGALRTFTHPRQGRGAGKGAGGPGPGGGKAPRPVRNGPIPGRDRNSPPRAKAGGRRPYGCDQRLGRE